MFTSTTVIDGNFVEFTVQPSNEVIFRVNRSYTWENLSCKVSITRWLLNQFARAKNESPFLLCSSFPSDEHFNVRIKAFKKLGFKDSGNGLLWTNGEISAEGIYSYLNSFVNTVQEDEDEDENSGDWRRRDRSIFLTITRR
jgi:hypothetical protein